MSKDTFYFSHDYNARNDIKIKDLIVEHGMVGYGVFWSIIEDLYNNANALPLKYKTIAYDLRVDESVVKSIINDFNLFSIEDEYFGSDSVQRRLDERNERSEKARESALYRWSKKKDNANASKKNANASKSDSDTNAIKERKGKETKDIYIYDLTIQDAKEISDYAFKAKLFFDLIRDNLKEKGQTNFTAYDNTKLDKWENDFRLMVEKDKRTNEEFNKIYAFLKSDTQQANFWKQNILSPKKIRDKFNTLIIRANGDEKKQQPQNTLIV